MRFVATLMLLIAFCLVRPLAGQAEGIAPCMDVVAAPAMDHAAMDHQGMDHHAMMDHEMGSTAPASEAPAPGKAHACASACCASPALMPVAGAELVRSPQPAFLVAAASPAATPVPHAPDLRPPIA